MYVDNNNNYRRKVLNCSWGVAEGWNNILYMCCCVFLVYKEGAQEEGPGCPGIVVKDACKLPCWCWELYPGPLQE